MSFKVPSGPNRSTTSQSLQRRWQSHGRCPTPGHTWLSPPHPAPPLSRSEELPTRTRSVGTKKNPKASKGISFPSQANGDGVSMAEQRNQPGGLSPAPVGAFISESRHQNSTGTSGAALLLHILLFPCPCTAPSPFCSSLCQAKFLSEDFSKARWVLDPQLHVPKLCCVQQR